MNQQQMQQALIGHDRIWCTMDFPLFYVKQRKDKISPLQLVERLERAACIAGWDTPLNPDQQKTNNFFLSLQDNTLTWYKTLDNFINFNREVRVHTKK